MPALERLRLSQTARPVDTLLYWSKDSQLLLTPPPKGPENSATHKIRIFFREKAKRLLLCPFKRAKLARGRERPSNSEPKSKV